MITPDTFFAEWDGKGIDFDGYYGFQCVDLFHQYDKECVGGRVIAGNAVDLFNNYDHDHYYQILNSPTNCPIKGDVVIWGQGLGPYGHIAVAKDGDANSFTSFDQNFPLGSLCHFQPHNYKNVLGWLRPGKEPVAQPEPIPAPVPPVVVPPTPDPVPTPPTPPTTPEPVPTPTPTPLPPVPPVLPTTPASNNWLVLLLKWLGILK